VHHTKHNAISKIFYRGIASFGRLLDAFNITTALTAEMPADAANDDTFEIRLEDDVSNLN